MTWNDLVYIAPEIILTIGASLLLVMPVIRRGSDAAAKTFMLVLLAVTATARCRPPRASRRSPRSR